MTRLALTLALMAGLLLVRVAPTYAVADPVGEWPLQPPPEVVGGFDPPETTWGPGHRGVDLSGSPGQRVHAALAGTVSFVGTIAGRGVVVVDHGETRTTYEPVTSTLRRGARVDAGEVIGSLGLPGSHCFPQTCLHWGWLRGETYLDPLRLVGGGPVRLLPLDGLVDPGETTTGAMLPQTSPYAGWAPPGDVLRPWPWLVTPEDGPAGRPAATGRW